jgi:hypothetical protein
MKRHVSIPEKECSDCQNQLVIRFRAIQLFPVVKIKYISSAINSTGASIQNVNFFFIHNWLKQ